MKQIPLLLIGLGAHAKRIYYKIAMRDGIEFGFKISHIIDIDKKRTDIGSFLQTQNDEKTPVLYVSSPDKTNGHLQPTIVRQLNDIVENEGIMGVIIATDPASHVAYSRWALSQRLSILMDKPVSVHTNASTDPSVPNMLEKDYRELLTEYVNAKKIHPRLLFSLMAQRRFHPAFDKIKSLIREVYLRTNCPITSIQSFHGDGQWRLPQELLDIPYHGYNEGYGKCSHSGYHFFDTMSWLLEAAEGKDKTIDSVEISVNAVRPNDYLAQITPADYKKLFPSQKIPLQKNLKRLLGTYGEIDAFCSFAFKHKDVTMTLGSVNLAHNSFSQRGWYSTAGRNLYKGNGRLRHETHIIEQGPFQAIEFVSLQSEEVKQGNTKNLFDPGGEYHLDIHVFRNHALFTDWKSYEKITISDLSERALDDHSRGHQEDARRKAMLEFVSFLHGKKINPISDFSDHGRSVTLLTGVYQSMANRFVGKNPIITFPFNSQSK
ncbi:MAG: hypothetical protein AAB937_00660 [Patescibacteria group bacterium]